MHDLSIAIILHLIIFLVVAGEGRGEAKIIDSMYDDGVCRRVLYDLISRGRRLWKYC